MRFVCLSVSLSDVTTYDDDDDDDSNSCITLHVRIANRVVIGSCCRGGIVNTRVGRSCALLVPPDSPKALWRFRVSTSNSPSGRSWLHARHAYAVYSSILTLNKIFEYVEMTICSRPRSSTRSPRRFRFFA